MAAMINIITVTLSDRHFPYNNVNDPLSQIARHLKLVFFTKLTRTIL